MTVERAPYGRREASGRAGLAPRGSEPASQPTYYGLPAVRHSHYRWLIVTYFFVGGLAGAAQLIAQVADLVGSRRDRSLVRAGRYLALLGALVSPALLIKDLHTPSRWYNMLRVVRPTSPMSIGAWTLAGFGALSGLAALGQLLEDRFALPLGRPLARAAGLPAATLGAVMAVYTGTLLGATSTPLWAAAYRHLPALFGATATATATAALGLLLGCSPRTAPTRRRLERLALVAGATQLALSLATQRHWRRVGVAAPLAEPPLAAAHRLGSLGLGVAVPLAVHGAHVLGRRRSGRLATLAAVATLLGGFVERAVVVFAGNVSGGRPEDAFRLAQPGAADARRAVAADARPR